MRNYIILNGKNSNTIQGLLIQSLAPITKPMIRTQVEEIDGRDGDIVTPLGYSSYDKTITIGLYGTYDVNEVIEYFNSNGTVIFSDEPDKYYNYQIDAQIDFERLIRFKTATVTMHCQPFKYSTTESPITLGSDPAATVSGEGTNIVLENSAEAPFSRFDLKGNTEQDTISGKNILPVVPQNSSGITTTYDPTTGQIHISGTPTSDWVAITPYMDTNISSGTTLTLSTDRATELFGITCRVRNSSGAGTDDVGFTKSASLKTKTTTNDNDRLQIWLNFPTPLAAIDTTFTLQLEKGSSASSFEPYVGGTASPNPDYPQAVKVVTGEQTVEVTGKNILKVAKISTSTGCSISYNEATGVFHVTGTPTGQWVNITNYSNVYIPSGTDIVMSWTHSNDSVIGSTIRVRNSGDINSNTDDVSSSNVHKVTTKDNDRLEIYLNFGTTLPSNIDLYLTFQLEYGSTATDFEPYRGQSYNIDLTPDLYNYESRTTGKYIDSAGTIGTSAAWDISDFMPVSAGETYRYKGITTPGQAPYSAFYNSSKNFVSSFKQASGDNTLAIPSGVAYVRFSLFSQDGDSKNFRFFDEPNKNELGQINNDQNYIYKDGNEWYIHKAVVRYTINDLASLDSLNWDSARNRLTFKPTGWGIKPTSSPSEIISAVSDKFEAGSVDTVADALNNGMCLSTGGYISLLYNGWADATEAQAAIIGTKIYYVLENAIEEKITNETLIAQLNDIDQHAHAYRTRTHINASAATGNVPHIIAAEVATDPSGTITNSGNIYSKPKLTIFGSGNVGVYLNGVQMFQIALGTNDHITIDTAIMEAYQDNLQTLKNRSVTGDYNNFKLPVGESEISFSGNMTMCVVENYSRWL